MKLLLLIFFFVLILVAFPFDDCFADNNNSKTSETTRPLIGLALSGGGVKGFAHVGVLKVLEEAGVDVDIVTGTSMGAIVGGLYAIGYTPAEIETLVVTTDWNRYLDDSPERRDLTMELKQYSDRYQISLPFGKTGIELPTGYLSGQRFGNVLNRMTWHVHDDTVFTMFPRKFACVATDLCAGEVVVLKEGFLPEAMRASFAIPGIFTAVEIDGKLLVDGSIARNFPVEDAIDLGATNVIGVDVGGERVDPAQLKSVIDVINQSFNYNDATSSLKQRSLCDLLIEPDISDISTLDFDKAELA
ncbi:MAG: patatin-like phospholipase family protein, partial [bacterium]|nr:patatin-like phospholipase family protein [bacterium]